MNLVKARRQNSNIQHLNGKDGSGGHQGYQGSKKNPNKSVCKANIFEHLDEMNDFLRKYVSKADFLRTRQPRQLTN